MYLHNQPCSLKGHEMGQGAAIRFVQRQVSWDGGSTCKEHFIGAAIGRFIVLILDEYYETQNVHALSYLRTS
jgi:hypothetical protein